jgi:kynurenine formamidase
MVYVKIVQLYFERSDNMRSYKIYDMSQPTYHNCPAWPTFAYPQIANEAICGNDGFTAERLNINVHTGTHLDAPYHFCVGGKTIDEISLDKFVGDAVIVELEGIINAKEGITVEHLAAYEDLIEEESIVLLHTGWDKKRSFSEEYYKDWPYVSKELAEWFVEKKVKGVGIDGFSVGGWYEGTGVPAHEVLLSNEIWALEELNFPEELLDYMTCILSAVPLKLKGLSGSPTRAYAIIEE